MHIRRLSCDPLLLEAPQKSRDLKSGMGLKIEGGGLEHLGGSVECLTVAQVMIPRFVGSSPASGSVLIAQSLETDSDSVSPSLVLPLPRSHTLSVSLKNK